MCHLPVQIQYRLARTLLSLLTTVIYLIMLLDAGTVYSCAAYSFVLCMNESSTLLE